MKKFLAQFTRENKIIAGAVVLIVFVVSVLGVTAGSLNPTSAPASTFYTLSQIFNPLASTSYDSSGIAADQNGSVIEILKYINANIGWASNSFGVYNVSSKIGIGTSSPATKLEVQGTASASYLLSANTLQVNGFSSASYSRFGANTTTASFLSSANDLLITGRFEVDGYAHFDLGASLSGNFTVGNSVINGNTNRWGINTLSPGTTLEVQGTASASYLLTGNTLQVGGFTSVAYSRFGTNTTSHPNYISTSSDLLISGDLEVRSSLSIGGNASISGTVQANINDVGGGSGNHVCYLGDAGSAVLSICASSIRYKEDVQPLVFNKANLLALQPVNYKWKNRNERGIGFIAEEVVQYIPEVVTYVEGKVSGLNYDLLTPYLLSLLKEHEQRLNSLNISNNNSMQPQFGNIIPNDVEFTGTVFFNSDSGGFAEITVGEDEVEIKFEKEFIVLPVINVSVVFDEAQDNSYYYFSDDIRHVVIKKTTKGFVIKLNKKTSSDILFNWTALAIKNPKTFTPLNEQFVVPIPVITPIVSESFTPAPVSSSSSDPQ